MFKYVSDAAFSEDGNYRWWLQRRWEKGPRCLVFVGLNPSTANACYDDPTLKRILGFAKCWNYNQLIVINLFAKISTSPLNLLSQIDPIGTECDSAILCWANRWASLSTWDLWFGWGCSRCIRRRDFKVLELLRNCFLRRSKEASGPLCIGVTKTGHPKHPLYMPKTMYLKPFKTRVENV